MSSFILLCHVGRELSYVLTARLELEGTGGRKVKYGQSFPINESRFLSLKELQEHLGDFGKVN